jgi:hypothetical protein
MGGACGMYRIEEEFVQVCGRNPQGKRRLECFDVNGSTILKCILSGSTRCAALDSSS